MIKMKNLPSSITYSKPESSYSKRNPLHILNQNPPIRNGILHGHRYPRCIKRKSGEGGEARFMQEKIGIKENKKDI